MAQALLILLTVATELSELAKINLPVLHKGEMIQREWFRNATYYRKTNLNGKKYIAQFNFIKRKSRRQCL